MPLECLSLNLGISLIFQKIRKKNDYSQKNSHSAEKKSAIFESRSIQSGRERKNSLMGTFFNFFHFFQFFPFFLIYFDVFYFYHPKGQTANASFYHPKGLMREGII